MQELRKIYNQVKGHYFFNKIFQVYQWFKKPVSWSALLILALFPYWGPYFIEYLDFLATIINRNLAKDDGGNGHLVTPLLY